MFGLEVSRLGRSNADLTRLMELARLTDTLLIDTDGVYDLANVNDRILLGLKGQMSEIELHFLLGRLHGAKVAAAHRGELRHPLPVGYVYDEDGQIVKDPDEQVRRAVEDLFAEFQRTGSALKTVRAFHETGRLFPQRAWAGAWAGTIKWGKLTHARVAQALKNPTYAGVYTFGKTREVRRVLPDGTVRSTRRRRAREDWAVLIQDHHEGYVTWAEFLATEAKLAANNTGRGARPVREGTALCQGIILCGTCGGRVGTRCSRKDSKVTYLCAEPTAGCRTVIADTVDDAVAALLLKTVTPQQIQVALAAADEVADRQVRTHRAAELAVERARYEADRAERAFGQVEPENRLVAKTLESRWEAKLAALAEAEAALATARAVKPPVPDHDALRALAADLPRLWDAPTTSPRDRKRLLRTLIADVTLLLEQDSDIVRIGVRWHTGATDELVVQRRGPGRTPPEALEIIRKHGATHSNVQIAKMLNDAGLRTGKNLRFTLATSRGCAASTRSSRRGRWPCGTGRSASNRPPSCWASPPTRSTTGCATGRSPPTAARDAGASPGTPRRRRSTGRRSRARSGSSRTRPWPPPAMPAASSCAGPGVSRPGSSRPGTSRPNGRRHRRTAAHAGPCGSTLAYEIAFLVRTLPFCSPSGSRRRPASDATR